MKSYVAHVLPKSQIRIEDIEKISSILDFQIIFGFFSPFRCCNAVVNAQMCRHRDTMYEIVIEQRVQKWWAFHLDTTWVCNSVCTHNKWDTFKHCSVPYPSFRNNAVTSCFLCDRAFSRWAGRKCTCWLVCTTQVRPFYLLWGMIKAINWTCDIALMHVQKTLPCFSARECWTRFGRRLRRKRKRLGCCLCVPGFYRHWHWRLF